PDGRTLLGRSAADSTGNGPFPVSGIGHAKGLCHESDRRFGKRTISEPRSVQADDFQGLEEIDDAEDLDEITKQTMRAFLGSVNLMIDSAGQLQSNDEAAEQLNVTGGPQFVDIKSIDVTREIDPNSQAGQLKKLRSRWDISFPQAMMWGVLS
ncbi:MAG: hypothetical protein ABGZ24_04025, partial [Fuerstiella sp.]